MSGATRLGDGSVAIANTGSYELRFYDGEARFLFAAGRQGEGPGEFTGLSRLVGARDSLFVYDQFGARISVFDRSGRFARSFSPPLLDGNRRSGFLGVFTDGSLLMATIGSYAASDPRRGIIRDSLTYVRADRSGEPLTSIARYPGNDPLCHLPIPTSPCDPGSPDISLWQLTPYDVASPGGGDGCPSSLSITFSAR